MPELESLQLFGVSNPEKLLRFLPPPSLRYGGGLHGGLDEKLEHRIIAIAIGLIPNLMLLVLPKIVLPR